MDNRWADFLSICVLFDGVGVVLYFTLCESCLTAKKCYLGPFLQKEQD